MKLITAAAFLDIPDNFRRIKDAYIGSSGPVIFTCNKKYIALRFFSNGCLSSRESGYLSTKGMFADSSCDGGPAIISYHDIGQVSYTAWAKDGTFHRDSALGPAFVSYDRDGTITSVEYRNKGRPHRPKKRGPAVFHYDRKYVEFWEDGLRIAEFDISAALPLALSSSEQSLDFYEKNFSRRSGAK